MLEDLLKPENIIMELESSDKDDVFSELLEKIIQRQNETLPSKKNSSIKKTKGLFRLFSKKSNDEKETDSKKMTVGIDRFEVLNLINERENKQSSNLNNGFSVMHVSCDSVSHPLIQIGISHDGIDFSNGFNSSKNHEKVPFVNVVIMVLLTKSISEEHLKLLSEVASIVEKSGLCSEILKAASKEQVCSLLKNL